MASTPASVGTTRTTARALGQAMRSARCVLRPDRSMECELLGRYEYVAGLDEVGRGALAGPVSVGLAVVGRQTDEVFPQGLADSKQLSARRREALVEPIAAWLTAHAVAHASPAEIDQWGIIAALRLAGLRALAKVAEQGMYPGIIILDGLHDWLTPPETDLFSGLDEDHPSPPWIDAAVPPVVTRVKADATCAVVAAASVVAKVERDALVAALPDPGYDWASNKGYASARHIAGLERLGVSDQHRRSWKLPGVVG